MLTREPARRDGADRATPRWTDRTVIEWDKDDIDALGLLKVDVLALGMLTCHPHAASTCSSSTTAADLHARHASRRGHRRSTTCSAAPTRSACSRSRAARRCRCCRGCKPRSFYDLVIEVAIVRPGPIQGDMVHPYLRRRDGIEPGALSLAVPSMDGRRARSLKARWACRCSRSRRCRSPSSAASFTPDEADQLRRAMATFRHNGTIHHVPREVHRRHDRRAATTREFAERCFNQIEGFGEYGFPESHAASFALLVYVSAWLKCHYPAVFCAALLNSQPMGFYAPAQLVRDAREHGVEVRAVDVNVSDWDCTLEPCSYSAHSRASGKSSLR